MKTINKNMTLMVIAAMLSIIEINAQNKNEKDENSLKVSVGELVQNNTVSHNNRKSLMLNIVVTSNNLYLKGATVKIFHNNRWIAALYNIVQPDLTVELERDSYYVLEVHKPGYFSKSILISTLLPVDSSVIYDDNTTYKYVVSVSLLKHVLFQNISYDASVPINGIIYFDPAQETYVGSPMIYGAPYKQEIVVQLENWLGN